MKLRTLQRTAFYYAQNINHPAFFLTMRIGKILLTIKDIDYNNVFPVLICAPLTTLYGWEEDLQKFGCTKNDYEVITGTKSQKKEKITNKAFILTNKEFFMSIPELIIEINFKAVVLDESTCIKNPKAAITKFYMKNFQHIQRRYVLTGTPMTGSEMDIFCQLQFLDPTIFKENNYYEFRYKYFYQLFGNEYKLKSYKKPEFYQKLNEKCCFISLNDLRKSIGKKRLETERIVRTVPMSKRFKKIYNKLKKEFIVSLDDKNLFGIQFILQQLVYLRKLCSGFLTLNPETKETQLVDSSKYDLLEDIINNEIPDYKVIILCNFYVEIYEIEKIFKQNKKKYCIITGKTNVANRGIYQKQFQEGKIQYIIANTECLKMGVTLSNADLTIEFTSVLGNITREQIMFRGTDIYNDNKISIMHLIVENSIEEYFYKKIGKQLIKKELIEELCR